MGNLKFFLTSLGVLLISIVNIALQKWEGDIGQSLKKSGAHVIVGSDKITTGLRAFRAIKMPDGNETHIMNRRVFNNAVDKANEELLYSMRKHGKLSS